MGFMNVGPFMGIISSYRMLWIGGRFGGHKTSLAYMIARGYLEQGYRLITNNRSVWADTMENVDFNERGQLKTVVILDEGGLFFKNSRQIEAVASYARKMDCIYLFPSFYPVARVAQVLTAYAMFNLNSAGIPAYFYKWRVKLGAFQDSGTFVWWNPSEIYGIYDTLDPGDTGTTIVEWLIRKTNEYRKMFGRGSDELPEVEVNDADTLSDAAGAMAEAADTIAAIPFKGGRRRRF